MRFSYRKMHGTGNQILVVDEREQNRAPPCVDALQRLGDEATGPGFDQLMWLTRSDDSAVAANYRVFNADGSEVEQCGNGVRCVASMLANNDAESERLGLHGPAGRIEAIVHSDGTVAVDMGAPIFEPARVPFLADAAADLYELDVNGTSVSASVLSMGNPHCVTQVASVSTANVGDLGPILEQHERFPQKANVGFMAIRDRGQIDLRVYERGVGETLACGTGACAAVVAGARLGLLDEEVSVRLPGGQVVVSWRGNGESVWLKGDTETISEGTIDL